MDPNDMSKKFQEKVFFLERKDFNLDGSLKYDLRGRYLLIMLGSSTCPHCITTVPLFDKFTQLNAQNKRYYILSGFVQANGEQRELGLLFKKLYNIEGVPMFLLYGPSGKLVKLTYEDRTPEELQNFVARNINI